MLKNKFIQILFLITLLSITSIASDNQRIIEELASPMPEIPLKSALGEKEYNDAIGSGLYRYVGNSKCRLCHRKFFLGRKNDPHDSAMKYISGTEHEENSNCLTCHSTGHRVETGYINQAKTPRLSNVQCEGCHGPGSMHIQMAKEKMKKKETFIEGGFLAGTDRPEILKAMCTKCHTQRWNKSYHDLDKSYDTYKSADPKTRKIDEVTY